MSHLPSLLCDIFYFHLRLQNRKDKEHLQYCNVCDGYKAPRSHHCRKCGRCVMKMDHHCPWLNCVSWAAHMIYFPNVIEILIFDFQCVGWSNHAYFTAFLIFSVIGCIQSSVILGASFWNGIHRTWYVFPCARCLWIIHTLPWSTYSKNTVITPVLGTFIRECRIWRVSILASPVWFFVYSTWVCPSVWSSLSVCCCFSRFVPAYFMFRWCC